MDTYWADNFASDVAGDAPAGWVGQSGSADSFVVTTTSPNGGKSVQISEGGMAKGPLEGSPTISNMTIYFTFKGPINQVLYIASSSIDESDIRNCIILQVEPDYTISVIGGNNEFLGNSYTVPACSPSSWNYCRLDLYLSATPTTPAYLAVEGSLYINSVAISVGGTVYTPIIDLPTGLPAMNYFAFAGAHSPYFTDVALVSAYTSGDPVPFAASSYSPPTVIDARVSNLVVEYAALPDPSARLSQFVIEIMIAPSGASKNYASVGVFGGIGLNSLVQ